MKGRGSAGFIRENLEAFAVAVAMALVIRHYCVEAFRIPTGSMKPALYGDHHGRGGERRQGDRILVDKGVRMRRDPRRFEVWVFRYPLNKGKNYIKRVAGLPGEWLRIIDGDLWVSSDAGRSWAIPQKPAGSRDRLLTEYWPHPVDRVDAFRDKPCWVLGEGWSEGGEENLFFVDAAAAEAALSFVPQVLPYPNVDRLPFGNGSIAGSGTDVVGDVRLSFRIEVEREGVLQLRIQEHGRMHVLQLGPDGSFLERQGEDGTRADLDWRLRAGGPHEVSLANVDDVLHAVLDGEERRLSFAQPRPEPPDLRRGAFRTAVSGDRDRRWVHGVSVAARGLKAALSEVRIDRDIFYRRADPADTDPWRIPEGCFFMLGDNTASSKDSRIWRVVHVDLKDGTFVEWEPDVEENLWRNPGARPSGGADRVVKVWADVNGLVRRFRKDDVARWGDAEKRPWVPRSNLIGRACVVFWPMFLPPVYRGPTRLKLIR